MSPPRKDEDYYSASEEEENPEFIALSQKYLSSANKQKKAVKFTLSEDEDDRQDVDNSEEDEEARDAWGREASAFYDNASDDASSEEEEDDQGVSHQLREARQLREQNLAALTAFDIEASMADFALTTAAKFDDPSQLNQISDEAVALDMLLGSLTTKKPSTEKAIPTDILEKSLGPAVVEFKTRCFDEVLHFVSAPENKKQRFTPTLATLMEAQLILNQWLSLITLAASIIGDSHPTVLAQAEVVLKAVKKITKLRKKIVGEDGKLLRSSLCNKKLKETRAEIDNKESGDAHLLNLSDLDSSDAEGESSTDSQPWNNIANSLQDADKISRLEMALKAVEQKKKERAKKEEENLSKMMRRLDSGLKGSNALKSLNKSNAKVKSNKSNKVLSELKNRTLINTSSKASSGAAKRRKELPRSKSADDPENNDVDKEEKTVKILDTKGMTLAKKDAREAERRKKALATRLAPLPKEIEEGDAREITKEIEKNRGLTRKRHKYEGNARVHNKLKYAKKLKKMSGVKMKAGEQSGSGDYAGESAGISMHVTRSRKLAV